MNFHFNLPFSFVRDGPRRLKLRRRRTIFWLAAVLDHDQRGKTLINKPLPNFVNFELNVRSTWAVTGLLSETEFLAIQAEKLEFGNSAPFKISRQRGIFCCGDSIKPA